MEYLTTDLQGLNARVVWEVLSLYYKNSVNKENVMPAAAASIQTFGDFLGFNPHLHIFACWWLHHFLKERMNYVREESMVIYKSKDGKNTKDFGALDFLFLRLEISDYGVYLCFILERSKSKFL